jgi:arginine/lysine/ornithine decarboxylase
MKLLIERRMAVKKLPLLVKLKQFSSTNPLSFHVPGHKNGTHSALELCQFTDLLKIDVTELNGLDDLHFPTGVIKEAEELLANLYSAEKSFFLVNGSTVGNLASIYATCEQDELVLVQRNCHKSIFNGLGLVGAKPVLLPVDVDQSLGIALGVNRKNTIDMIHQHPNAKAIILTNPNYYGMSQNLDGIIELAHFYGIPVIVDEAHGAHFIIGKPFPKSAISMGADLVIHSAHKTLPAMTMGSFLHVKSSLVKNSKVASYLSMLQSSSPSYPIMASLDLARAYLENLTNIDIQKIEQQIHYFCKKLQEIPEIELVYTLNQNYQQDLLKVMIKSKSGLTGFELQKELEHEHVYTELSDWQHVLFVLPLDTISYIDEAFEGISRAVRGKNGDQQNKLCHSFPSIASQFPFSFKELMSRKKEQISLHNAVGRICARNVTPYPPGIPVILDGELISEEHIKYVKSLQESGGYIQNIVNENDLKIEVYCL